MIIMSLKDQGNEYFRVGRYAQAIKCYQEYVQFDPQADKKAAFCNISFCHYKLKDYKDSIESADDSISEDPTYNKAYYRKMQAYKQLPDSDYDVYINAVLLLKYSPNMLQTEKYDYQVLIKQYKEKWMEKLERDRVNIQQDACIFEDFEGKIEVQNQRRQIDGKIAEEWIEEWMQTSIAKEQHWDKIQRLAKENKEYGLNLAFLYLNHCPVDRPEYKVIKQKLAVLQALLEGKMEIEQQEDLVEQKNQAKEVELPVKQEHKKSQSSDQNLFQSSDHSNETPNNHHNQLASTTPPPSDITQYQIQNQSQAPQRSLQTNIEGQQPYPVSEPKALEKGREMIQNNLTMLTVNFQDIDKLYKAYTANIQQSRDLMTQLLRIVERILSQPLSLNTKYKLLETIKQRYGKTVNLMKKSFSKKQQQKVYDLLMENKLEIFIPDFASRYVPQ